MNKFRGELVEIINENSKYYLDVGIIVNETNASYYIISTKKIPIRNRFMYDNADIVIGLTYPHVEYCTLKKYVRKLGQIKSVNVGSVSNKKLLNENLGLTKAQIEIKY